MAKKDMLNDILGLIEKSGDTCVVVMEEKAFVLMPLERYKQLALNQDGKYSVLTESENAPMLDGRLVLSEKEADPFSIDTSKHDDIMEGMVVIPEEERVYSSETNFVP